MEDWNIGGLQQRIMVYSYVGEEITTNYTSQKANLSCLLFHVTSHNVLLI